MRNTASLSTKLVRIGASLLVVALVSIGLTLWVTWRLSGGAAALNEAGRMRMQTWRLTSAVQAKLNESEVQALVSEFDESIRLLRQGDPERPLFVPWDEQVKSRFDLVDESWREQRNLLISRPQIDHVNLVKTSEAFLEVIDRFVLSIEHQLASLTAILNLFQFVMMALAIGGAVIMLYTGYHYVIHPLSKLRDGLRKLERAQFSVRVEVSSNDEFGQVAQGFNRMAATLQSLYGNLEAQVIAKTERIAAQKERLQALYEVSAFLAKANTLHELTQGFARQVRELMKADALAIRWTGDDPDKFLILSSDNFPLAVLDDEKCLRAGVCACGNSAFEARTRVIPIKSSDMAPLRHCNKLGYETLISVPVKLQNKVLGEIDLFYRNEVHLTHEELELVDTFASHLASSVEGMRALAMDREAAIAGERTMLARELHDSIAQSLAFLKIQAGLLRSSIAKNDGIKTAHAMNELDQGLKESIADVRELLLHFRTRTQSDDIDTAIQETLQKFQHQSGITVVRKIFGDGLPLAQDVQIHVLHVLQEALSNIRKHANAKNVSIEIKKGETWCFIVCDDGVGFDGELERTQLQVGLNIMRERAAQIKAEVEINSQAGYGTVVKLLVPGAQKQNPNIDNPNVTAGKIMSEVIRLLVVDDHPLFRRGLISLLSQDERFSVVGEAGDIGEALRILSTAIPIPDVMLLDNHLPGVKGVDAIPSLKQSYENLRILMLTVSEDEDDLAKALQNGADGYLLKTSESDQLCSAIVMVNEGQSVVSPDMMNKLISALRQPSVQEVKEIAQPVTNPLNILNSLSPREREIFLLIAKSLSNKQIARDLDIAETTVKIHIQHIFKKLELTSRVQIAVFAATHGLT